jgi:dipeptidyl aminopeptidase/acylaminoacyl peptidase
MRAIGFAITAAVAAAVIQSPTSAAPAAPAAEHIPAEAFGALPTFSSPRISPDGKRILAQAYAGGEKVIVVYDVDGTDGRFTRIDVGDKLEVLSARWAGPRRILLTVYGLNKTMGVELPLTRLFLFDLDTRALKALGGEKVGGLSGGNVIYVDEQGAFLLLEAQRTLGTYPSVLRIELDTLKTKEIAGPYPGVWNWYADAGGAIRAGLGSEDDKMFLLYREKEAGSFRRIAAKHERADTLSDLERVIPIAGSDKGYAIANSATGRYGVYRYDFAKDELGEPIFQHPEVDVDGADYSRRTGTIDAVYYVDERERIVWLDPEMKKIQARLDKALPDRVNRIVSRDGADSRMLVWSTGASDPGTYYLYDRAKSELREVAKPYSALEGKTLAPVEAVRYTARDGLAIPAYLTRPHGRGGDGGGRGLPLVVMPHGGPFVRDKWEYDDWAQFLANRGYAVLQPNFRGSTGYGKAFVEAASGQFGRKMQDDLDDGVAWLVRRGIVDPKRVCIMGASYGGYAAMWAAARNPEIYRCAISFAGISEVRTMLHYDPSSWVARRYYRDWRDRIRGEDKFNLDAVSPLSRAAGVKVPLLIAHGEKDTTVPVTQSKKMDEALRRAGIAHEFVLYPEEKHGFSKTEDAIDFLKRVEAFLAKYNPAD